MNRHVRAILALPCNVLGTIPAIVLLASGAYSVRPSWRWLPAVAFAAAGLFLMARTIALFARRGEGTLAPWDPTARLVVTGPYRYVRHPMITGVLCVLLGEVLFFGSVPLGVWWLVFLLMNAVYLPFFEEPGLVRRFGSEYETYRRHVPRWIPRRTPWSGADDG